MKNKYRIFLNILKYMFYFLSSLFIMLRTIDNLSTLSIIKNCIFCYGYNELLNSIYKIIGYEFEMWKIKRILIKRVKQYNLLMKRVK